jgi:hypothetical protein
MPATIDEVKQVIEQEFPGSDVRDIQEINHRISGTIIWQDFKDKTVRERNRLVTEKVRNRLGLEGMNVDFLFPLAPGEKL